MSFFLCSFKMEDRTQNVAAVVPHESCSIGTSWSCFFVFTRLSSQTKKYCTLWYLLFESSSFIFVFLSHS